MYNQNGNNFMPHQGFNNRYNYNTQNFAYSLPGVNQYPPQYSVPSYPPPSVFPMPSYSTTRVPMFATNIPFDVVEPNHGTVHYDVSTYEYSTSDYCPPTVSHFSNGSPPTNVSVNYQQKLSGLPCSSHQQDKLESLPKVPQHQSGKVEPPIVVKEQRNTSKTQGEIESVPSHKCKSDSVPNSSTTESDNETSVSEGENVHGRSLAFAELTAHERDSKIPHKRNMLFNNKEIVHRAEIDVFNKSENFNEHICAGNKSKILSTVSNTHVNTCNRQDYYNQKFQLPVFQSNQPLNTNLPNDSKVQIVCPFPPNEYSSSDNLSSNLISPPAFDNRFDSGLIAGQSFLNTPTFFQTQIPSNRQYRASKIEGRGEISEKFAKLSVGKLHLTSSNSRTPHSLYSSSNSVRQRWNENTQYDQNSQRRRISNDMASLVSYNAHLSGPSTSSLVSQMGTAANTVLPPRRCHSLQESSFDQSKQEIETSSHSQINLNSNRDRCTTSSNSLDAFHALSLLDDPIRISRESLSEMASYQEVISNDLKQNKRTSKTENSISYTSLRQDIENASSSETNSRSSERETGSSNMSQGTYRQASFKQSSLDILLDESKLTIHSYITTRT